MHWVYTFVLSGVVNTALAATGFASTCNPLESDNCPIDVALGTSARVDFTKENDLFAAYGLANRILYTSEGLVAQYNAKGDSPSLRSNFYLMYGKVEIKCRIAPGTGIVSNFFLQLDDLDEIDIEWLGAKPKEVQLNFFGKGVNTATGSTSRRDLTYTTSDDLTLAYHTYTIDWTLTSLTWLIDGKVMRTIEKDKLENDGLHDYPSSPMRVFIGLWAGGDSDAIGTQQWAGGKTDTSGVPYKLQVEYFSAVDYSTGKSYLYKDKKGTITSDGGSVDGNLKGQLPSSNTTPALLGASSTASSSSSSSVSTASSTSSSTSLKATSTTSSLSVTSSSSSLSATSSSSSLTTTSTSSSLTTTSTSSSLTTTSTSSSLTTTSTSSSSTSSSSKSTEASSSVKATSTFSTTSGASESSNVTSQSTTSASPSKTESKTSSSSTSSSITSNAHTSTTLSNSTVLAISTTIPKNLTSEPAQEASTSFIVVNHNLTIVLTTTHCSSNVCLKVTLTTHSVVPLTSTAVVTKENTRIETLTSCDNNECYKNSTAAVTTTESTGAATTSSTGAATTSSTGAATTSSTGAVTTQSTGAVSTESTGASTTGSTAVSTTTGIQETTSAISSTSVHTGSSHSENKSTESVSTVTSSTVVPTTYETTQTELLTVVNAVTSCSDKVCVTSSSLSVVTTTVATEVTSSKTVFHTKVVHVKPSPTETLAAGLSTAGPYTTVVSGTTSGYSYILSTDTDSVVYIQSTQWYTYTNSHFVTIHLRSSETASSAAATATGSSVEAIGSTSYAEFANSTGLNSSVLIANRADSLKTGASLGFGVAVVAIILSIVA